VCVCVCVCVGGGACIHRLFIVYSSSIRRPFVVYSSCIHRVFVLYSSSRTPPLPNHITAPTSPPGLCLVSPSFSHVLSFSLSHHNTKNEFVYSGLFLAKMKSELVQNSRIRLFRTSSDYVFFLVEGNVASWSETEHCLSHEAQTGRTAPLSTTMFFLGLDSVAKNQ
jgi:hypothetical protein